MSPCQKKGQLKGQSVRNVYIMSSNFQLNNSSHFEFLSTIPIDTRFWKDSIGKGGSIECKTSSTIHSDMTAQTIRNSSSVDCRLAQDWGLWQRGYMKHFHAWNQFITCAHITRKSNGAVQNETWFTYISVTLFRVSPNILCDIPTSSRAVNTNKQQNNMRETLTVVLKQILLWEMYKSTTYLKFCRLKWDPRREQEMRSVTAKQTDINEN